MTDKIILNVSTEKQINAFLVSNSHAALIEAPKGAGKDAILKLIATKSGANRNELLIIVNGDSKSISIDEIRELKRRLKLKTGLDDVVAVLIKDAERLTIEAQNAFLKLLEEPPERVVFLLSTSNHNKLLPTIVSRTTILPVLKPSALEVMKILEEFPAKEVERALALSEGWPGLALKILNDKDKTFTAYIDTAKEILSLNELEKLRKIDGLAKDKTNLPMLLFALERVLHSGLHASRFKNQNLDLWKSRLEAVEQAQSALALNVTTRLLLCKLMLAL